MKLLFCSCRLCRSGRRTKYWSGVIQYRKRAARHKVKRMLKKGRWEDLPEKIAIGYTD